MSGLREVAAVSARRGAHPLLSVERLLASERVAAGIEARRIGRREAWDDLVARLPGASLAALPAADQRRLLLGIWTERSIASLAGGVVEQAAAGRRRSLDRAIVEAYLLRYPSDHPAFGALRAAAALAADRHDWRWREAGARWSLWDGPAGLGDALRDTFDARRLLHETGFVGRLANGVFLRAARGMPDSAR